MFGFVQAVCACGLIAALSACGGPAPQRCAPGYGSPMAVFNLYFGKTVPGRPNVTDQEWLAFLNGAVTPSLPHGYTVLDGNGAWMDPATLRTKTEPTKVLVAAMPEAPESLNAINQVRIAYQMTFHQQRVGMTVGHACGEF